ncbi:MAG: hypothetical protein A3D27_01075 [Omnitrophica WOR_2 bacterium RIFCSPHIGHO2_02_FULL_46_37]|nr:MAG: hypothetical protein A3D27_01075 [Omnitrophica WOR_2 bacterium RIFCSPHIGHO2_02_FULL_46_37]OGX43396.1 MAG: hypothetical protein A3H41_04820 [Omnitrophica WOR_2 bacterium RIFCSPLOWO2_02_FULL_45_28]
MKNKIKAIIFDLGNVLVGFDHRIAVRRILKHTSKPEREIYDLFFDSGLTREFEKGKITPGEFFKQVKSLLELKLELKEFLPIWNEIFFSKPESEEFIVSLNSGLKLVLLSNINKLHYDYIRNAFSSAIALFGPGNVIPSYITGFVKPEREIYNLAIRKTGRPIENIVYVDDRRDLVEAARGYGLRVVQFQNIEQLRQEFQNLGVIENAHSPL